MNKSVHLLHSVVRCRLYIQLYHYLIDETKMEFPEEFLKRWLQTGGEQAKTPEQTLASGTDGEARRVEVMVQ